MKKILISDRCYPIVLGSDLNLTILESSGAFRHGFCIKEESEVYINGEHKYTAKPGDVIISFYDIEDRYTKTEYFLIPGEFFGDYFVRLEKYKNGKQSNINSAKQCCDCAEPKCCDCAEPIR